MTQNSKNNPSGCLWLILAGFFTLFGSVVLNNLLSISANLALILALIIATVLSSTILRIKDKRFTIRNGAILLVLFLVFKAGVWVLTELMDTSFTNDFEVTKNEQVKRTTVLEGTDSIIVYKSDRVWKDNFYNNYKGSLIIREKDYLKLQSTPINFPTNYEYNSYWGQLYNDFDRRDSPSLDLVMEMFEGIHETRNLNQMEFAEMVVSCIQDIPYSFVFQEACQSADFYEEDIARILRDCPDCCIGGIPFGVQTPVAFLQNLKGDCDTRTVIIYTILKHFNYDVAILNSDFYRHSILGLNIPASGVHKKYNGKKYMLWETTAKYYKAGALPASFKEVTHWNVVLTSK